MAQVSSTTIGTPRRSRVMARIPVFYGWIILAVGSLGMIMTSPGQTYAVSIFIESFISDLGINRTLVSTLYGIGTVIGSLALPLIGRLVDQRGPRVMVVIIAFAFGAACIYMGFIQNAIMLGLGFVLIRMLGQGSLSLVSTYTINQWWVERRGTMLGISGMAMSILGLGGFPTLINWLIPQFGWRSTYIILGLAVAAIMIPVGAIFYRERPEVYGLKPDGQLPDPDDSLTPPVAEENWTAAEAMRTPLFWIFTLGMASVGMLSTGLFFHMVSIFEDNGLGPGIAAAAFMPIAVTTAITNMISSLLVNRVRMRVLLALTLWCQAAALILAQYLTGTMVAFGYGIILGATSGLMRTVATVSWPKYFGRLHLGSITGITTTAMVFGSALGPFPFGLARDTLGSYGPALWLTAVIPLVLSLVSLFTPVPHRSSDG